MLKSLQIENYAIIEFVRLDFHQALTIITGETGAGKSIILGALGLIRGKRADTKVLYDLNKKAYVEAEFLLSASRFSALFEALDLDFQEQTIIRREIRPSGKTRAFVNDSPVKLEQLKALADRLLDVHQQFDTLDIQEPDYQLHIMDALAGNLENLAQYELLYGQYEGEKSQLRALERKQRSALKEQEFIAFQLKELLEAELYAGEQEELEQEQKQLSHAEDIKRVLSGLVMGLTEEEPSLSEQLTVMSNQLYTVSDYQKDLPELAERLEGLRFELEELSNGLNRIAEDTEYDDERLEEVNERLDLLFRLQKKHHLASEEELLELQEELQQQLDGFEGLEEQIEQLKSSIIKKEKQLWQQGKALSAKREKAIGPFEGQLRELLQQLSMKYARLKVDLAEAKELGPKGIDQLRFLFSANKGGRLEEIRGIASGGELSRLALCIKSMMAGAITLPTLIFDEIDTGVSGEVALQMGQILQQLSAAHQVVSITHSPQIAAKARKHYFVHKEVIKDRTVTAIKELEKEEERVEELAKMLSGNPPSAYAKANAKELLAR